MGSHFNDWTEYNGLAFAMELHRVRRMGFAKNFGVKKFRGVKCGLFYYVSNHDQRIYRVHVL